jgi:hypothetical protein
LQYDMYPTTTARAERRMDEP